MNGLWRFFGSLPPHPWAFNGASRREPAISAVMDQFIILIGLMGAGKSNVGKRLAARLEMPFIDTDDEIELAAGCSIEDIFEEHGEAYFRDGERRVIARLLEGEPAVMATGGGAFMNEETRRNLSAKGTVIWLRAELDLLLKRTRRRDNRPLLKRGDPRETLQSLIDQRYPIYGEADIIVDVREEPADMTTGRVLEKLEAHHDRPDG